MFPLWMSQGNESEAKKKGVFKHHVNAGSFHIEVPLQTHSNLYSGKFKLDSTLKEVSHSQNCVFL